MEDYPQGCPPFLPFTFLLLLVSSDKDSSMEDYVDQIEKFLRGQMSLQDEAAFKASLGADESLCLLAFIVTVMMRREKTG